MKRARVRADLAAAAVVGLMLLGSLFLATIGIDALEGRNDFAFFADSATYHEAARGGLGHIDGLGSMVGVASNFLGPLVLLRVAAENYYAVLALNCGLLLYAVLSLARTLRLNAPRLLGLLLLNPITLSSILSVNKEIISLVFIALAVRACVRGSLPTLIAAVLVSFLVRWQLTAFVVTALILCSPTNPFVRRRGATLLLLLVCLSVLYTQLAVVFEPIRLSFEFAAEDYEGSGAYKALIDLQDRGLYWAVFPLKAAHLLFGMGLRLDRLVQPVDMYNDVWQLLHSTSLLIIALVLWRAGRLRLDNDLIYLSLIYVAVFALTPIYTPRYFYPVYVIWALALAESASRPASRFLPTGRSAARRHSRPIAPSSGVPTSTT